MACLWPLFPKQRPCQTFENREEPQKTMENLPEDQRDEDSSSPEPEPVQEQALEVIEGGVAALNIQQPLEIVQNVQPLLLRYYSECKPNQCQVRMIKRIWIDILMGGSKLFVGVVDTFDFSKYDNILQDI